MRVFRGDISYMYVLRFFYYFFKIQVGFIDYAVLLVVDTTFCISYMVKFQENCVGQFQ